ncbi:MAG: amino acid ABC transporter ATP-binding protein [Anaerovoracaceae bacterium]
MKINVKSLVKAYNKKVVLDGLNLTDEINTLAIIGPSGCGKSTFLRILAGLEIFDQGALEVDGESLPTKENLLIEYRRKIGFVFQKEGLFKHMTAIENIIRPLVVVHNIDRQEATKMAMDLLERFGLLEEANKYPSQLSGGQQQRISIARAIAPMPKLLLLDEPTSALDPEYTTEVLDMINELKKSDIKFIIVTHEMGFARHACEKVAFISNGVISEFGSSDEVFANPKTDELKKFLGKLLEWNV